MIPSLRIMLSSAISQVSQTIISPPFIFQIQNYSPHPPSRLHNPYSYKIHSHTKTDTLEIDRLCNVERMGISPDPVQLEIAWHSMILQSRIDNVSILSVRMAICQLFIDRRARISLQSSNPLISLPIRFLRSLNLVC
jgi:hypothetical protein